MCRDQYSQLLTSLESMQVSVVPTPPSPQVPPWPWPWPWPGAPLPGTWCSHFLPPARGRKQSARAPCPALPTSRGAQSSAAAVLAPRSPAPPGTLGPRRCGGGARAPWAAAGRCRAGSCTAPLLRPWRRSPRPSCGAVRGTQTLCFLPPRVQSLRPDPAGPGIPPYLPSL